MSDQPTSEIRMPKGAEGAPRNAREKRARIALIALTAGFGLLLVVQGPTLLDAINGGGGDTPAAEGTASADTAGSEGAAAAAAAAAETASLDAAGGEVTPPGALRDSDLPQRARIDELSRIDNFSAGEPFTPLVSPPDPSTTDGSTDGSGTTSGDGGVTDPATDAPTGDSEGGSTEPTGSESRGSAGQEETEDGTRTPTDESFSAAQLSINDIREQVSVEEKFPTSNPVFVVNSVTANAVEIGLVEGAFSTGTQSITIELGETRTLVSQPDGVRYSVRFDEPIGG